MDLDRDARRVLDLARQQRTPTAADRARVAQRLALGLGLSAAATSTAAAQATTGGLAAKTAAASAVLKWSIAGSVLVAVAAGGYVTSPASAPRAPAKPAASAKVAAPATPPTVSAKVPAAAVSPEQPTAQATAPAHVPAARERMRVQERPRRASRSPQLAQVELLHSAQAAWRAGDASTALSLLGEHRARWPRSSLRFEREALQVLTLCDLGRKSEASHVARRLLARAPRSPLRASIEDSCAFE